MQTAITQFGGIVPRTPEHNLSVTQATLALNVNLRRGQLEPWRELCRYKDVPSTAVSLYMYGHCLYTWDSVVSVAELSPDWQRLYVTGNSAVPQVMVRGSCCDMTYYTLGAPTPPTPPKASGQEQCGRASDTRSYVYTWVNQWGEESAPSPASNLIMVADGTPVSVTGISLPPDGYGIIGANLYRTSTGFRPTDGKNQTPLTDYLFVDTIYFPSVSYTDNVLTKKLGMPLETADVMPPPEALQNITAVEGVIRLAGSVANRVYLSENFQPYNWPVKYELTLDSSIIHMKCLDQKLYVTTSTTPYIIDVSSCDDTKCTPVTDIGRPLPDISCGHYNSAIITPFGLIYSSDPGVILIDPSARWHILTSKWLTAEQWHQLAPETARFEYWNGYLFIVTDETSFILDIDGDPYGDVRGMELSNISDAPVAMQATNTGQLMFLQDSAVWFWDKSDTFRPFEWKSRELYSPSTETVNKRSFYSPAALRLRSVQTFVRVEDDHGHTVYERTISGDKPVRLPKCGRHLSYRLYFTGTETVEFAELGTAIIAK